MRNALVLPMFLLAAAACSAKGASPAPESSVAGTAALSTYRAQPSAIVATNEAGLRADASLHVDGSFSLSLPKGHTYKLAMVTPSGEVPLVFPRPRVHPEPREGDREVGNGLGVPAVLGGDHRARRNDAALLRFHPLDVAPRLQLADARRAQRRRRAIRENVEHARILQNSERVFIHDDTINWGCSTPLSRSG